MSASTPYLAQFSLACSSIPGQQSTAVTECPSLPRITGKNPGPVPMSSTLRLLPGSICSLMIPSQWSERPVSMDSVTVSE